MTKNELYHYISDPNKLDKNTLPQLEKLVETYPYAGGIVFLYLYNLFVLGDVRYPLELQRLSIRLPNRSLLYGIAEHKMPFKAIKVSPPKSSESSFSLIEQFLDERSEDATQSITSASELAISEDYFAATNYTAEHVTESFDTLITKPTQHNRSNSTEKNDSSEGVNDATWNDTLFTETLARTYAQQKRFDKALSVFEAIEGKNSEKSAYFAQQIEFLRLLTDNKKEEQQ